MELDVSGARAEHVRKTRAHLGTLACLPADTHTSLHIILDGEMALIVVIFTDGDALETCSGGLAVDLSAECFFGRGSRRFCRLAGELVGVLDAAEEWSAGSGGAHPVVELVFVRAGVEVCVSEEVVRVQEFAHCRAFVVRWRRARSRSVYWRLNDEY